MPQTRSLPVRILRSVAILMVAWLALSWLVVLILRFVPPWTSAVMMERRLSALVHGQPGFEIHQRWVPWERVSPYVPLAMVAGEDQKFPFHHGFDVDAIQDAIDAADDGKRLRGASTISQQTAKNLFLPPDRTWTRKGIEAYLTVLIEALWPKRRILETYLNIVEWGPGRFGAEAAARADFKKPAAKLSVIEAARLAAVLPNPKEYSAVKPGPYVTRQAEVVAARMGEVRRDNLDGCILRQSAVKD